MNRGFGKHGSWNFGHSHKGLCKPSHKPDHKPGKPWPIISPRSDEADSDEQPVDGLGAAGIDISAVVARIAGGSNDFADL